MAKLKTGAGEAMTPEDVMKELDNRLNAEAIDAQRTYKECVLKQADGIALAAADLDALAAALKTMGESPAEFHNDVERVKAVRRDDEAGYQDVAISEAEAAERAASLRRQEDYKAKALAEIAVRQEIDARESLRSAARNRADTIRRNFPLIAKLAPSPYGS